MRWPVMHGPMRAHACSRSLLYPRVGETVFHRTLVNNVKAVFVLVALRRFPQFSDNQREGNHFCNEKPCSYEHDCASSMICARISHFVTYFVTLNLFRAFRLGEFTRGTPGANDCAWASVILFRRLCPALFCRHNLSDFGQFCQNPEHPIRALCPSPTRNIWNLLPSLASKRMAIAPVHYHIVIAVWRIKETRSTPR